jgi:hypothetical protein
MAWHALMIKCSNFPFTDSLINPSSDTCKKENFMDILTAIAIGEMRALLMTQDY